MPSPQSTYFKNATSSSGASIDDHLTEPGSTAPLTTPDGIGSQRSAHHSASQRQRRQSQQANHNVDGGEDAPQEVEPQCPSILPRTSSVARHTSYLDEDEAPPESQSPPSTPTQQDKPGPVSWRDLPKKSQLAVLTLARLSEPLTQTSLQAYMFYQLQSFDPSLPTSTISAQAGMLQSSFTAAQFVTAIMWGRMADAEWGGRKRVLLIGLAGTGISCVGFGFSRTFWQAMVFRTLGGSLNGNVGVMRTMISEIIEEKRFQSRAFLLLPMCFNIGTFGGMPLSSIADPESRCHHRTNSGWIAFRSREELSKCLRRGLAVWGKTRCCLAEALALCFTELVECCFLVQLCHGSHFGA